MRLSALVNRKQTHRGFLCAWLCLTLVATCAAAEDDTTIEELNELSPIWANAACYVCHVSFVKEELGKVHLEAQVACIKCHGLSAPHANDEHIGATPPDVMFGRGQIDRMCVKCHETHDAPAREVVARFVGRSLSPKNPTVCTDCHGTHKIERSKEGQFDEPSPQ
ncbi:MAG TPA: cytochrome c3 family protein [Thermoguttaceae bacterium]|nr:cytochrome c3 family protein [Thermoguttaceae bacterium]